MNKYLTPVAIIVVGLLIAGAIFFTKGLKTNSPITNNLPTASTIVTAVTPVNENDHILGNPQANIVVVEYGDLECPPCKLFHTTMHQIMNGYAKSGQVAWVFRHAPLLDLHTKAIIEAQASECADLQGGNDAFWKYIDKIYDITPSNNNLDLAELSKIAKSFGLDMTKFNFCLSNNETKNVVEQNLNDMIILVGEENIATPHVEMILKNILTEDKIANLIATFGDNLYIKDEKHISFAGAYPYEALKTLVDIILE